MLTEQLVDQLQVLQALHKQDFTRVVNYAINYLINSQNTLKLHQFIEIGEEEGDRITAVVLRMLHALVQYRTNAVDSVNHIKLIRLDKERSEYLREKIAQNMEELRKSVFREELEELTQLQALEWRYQVELASKNSPSTYTPNILLNFKVKDATKITNNLVNSDFANIKHLSQALQAAMKMHQSQRFKMARNSSI